MKQFLENKTRFFILFLILIGFVGSSFAEELEIKFGETVSYENLTFYFYDIEDSRCPLDVTCFWEGRVLPMIHINNETHKIGGGHAIGIPLTFFDPYTITVINVEPHPISTEKPDYVVTLDITKPKPLPTVELSDEDICGTGNILVDGMCVNPNVDDFDAGLNQVILLASIVGIVIGMTIFIIWRKRK